MSNLTLWIIIIGFFAPLHYMLPVVILFITGKESEADRKTLIRQSLLDSTLSMVIAFIIAIFLVNQGAMAWAMVVLLAFMTAPFVGILLRRRSMAGRFEQDH